MRAPVMRCAWLAVFLGLAAAAAPAQSLLDNEFYKNAKDLIALSQEALHSGDYDSAARLASEARDALARSDEHVATMTLFYLSCQRVALPGERPHRVREINQGGHELQGCLRQGGGGRPGSTGGTRREGLPEQHRPFQGRRGGAGGHRAGQRGGSARPRTGDTR